MRTVMASVVDSHDAGSPYSAAGRSQIRDTLADCTQIAGSTGEVTAEWARQLATFQPRPTVGTASRIGPAAAMPICPVAASAITWCDSGSWWRRACSRLIDLGTFGSEAPPIG
jgi:hypothetical protein